MISGLWARLLYLMIISGSGSNLANNNRGFSYKKNETNLVEQLLLVNFQYNVR